MVFKSKRQSRLTVATIFLRRLAHHSLQNNMKGNCILKSWSQATRLGLCGRCSSRGRGSHPRTVQGLRAQLTTIDRTLIAGGRGKLSSSSGERQRSGRSECLSLGGIGGVGVDCGLHIDSIEILVNLTREISSANRAVEKEFVNKNN